MGNIKIGMIGNGWRSESFLTIISELPDLFELSGVFFRNEEKAKAFSSRYPNKAFTDFDEFCDCGMDYAILVVPRDVVLPFCEKLYQKGIPVLCETPPANGLEELTKAWEFKQAYHGKIQVMEQYFLQPYHAAVLHIIENKLIGNVTNATINMIHDYHGISMLRKILGANFNNCRISAREFSFPVVETCGRGGMNYTQTVTETDIRKTAIFEFENQTVGFFDFSGEQYFNYLRSRHLNVQGVRGEIYDTTARFLTSNGMPITQEFQRIDLGQYSNLEGFFHRGIMLGSDFIYQNPFADIPTARLTDDEIAIATAMLRMKDYITQGEDFYSLADALQDTYLYLMMDQSIASNKPIETQTQIWAKPE